MKTYFLTYATLGIMSVYSCSLENNGDKKMNVIFIAYDDLRPDLNCYGNKEIISPNIDALAKQGCLFRNQFVQVSTCGASRSCLMTGRYPRNLNAFSNNAFEPFKKLRNSGVKPRLRDTETIVTLPELFKLGGYTTVAVGKLSHLAKKGDMPGAWDREYSYLEVSKYPEQKIGPGNLKERLTAKMIDAPDNAFTDGLVTEQAILELNALKESGSPFFLGVGFHLPHLPFYAPKKYWDFYDRNQLKIADNTKTPVNCKREISLHNNFEMRGQYTQLDVPDAEAEARILRHGYYACVSYTDALTGKIMAELDKLGMKENTIIVLWGDNGFHLGEYGIWGKHTCFDYGLRTPLIIVDPELKKKGTVVSGLFEEVDIYPTLAEVCKITPPINLDGQSLVPWMNNPELNGKKFIRGFLAEGEWRGDKPTGYTIRTDKYRLVQWRDRKTNAPISYSELYDHNIDTGETVNIADKYPEKVNELSKLITPIQ